MALSDGQREALREYEEQKKLVGTEGLTEEQAALRARGAVTGRLHAVKSAFASLPWRKVRLVYWVLGIAMALGVFVLGVATGSATVFASFFRASTVVVLLVAVEVIMWAKERDKEK